MSVFLALLLHFWWLVAWINFENYDVKMQIIKVRVLIIPAILKFLNICWGNICNYSQLYTFRMRFQFCCLTCRPQRYGSFVDTCVLCICVYLSFGCCHFLLYRVVSSHPHTPWLALTIIDQSPVNLLYNMHY